jgi:hypothetical protein
MLSPILMLDIKKLNIHSYSWYATSMDNCDLWGRKYPFSLTAFHSEIATMKCFYFLCNLIRKCWVGRERFIFDQIHKKSYYFLAVRSIIVFIKATNLTLSQVAESRTYPHNPSSLQMLCHMKLPPASLSNTWFSVGSFSLKMLLFVVIYLIILLKNELYENRYLL